MKLKISAHAIKRYRERVAPLPDDMMLCRMELFSRLFSSKPKHWKKLNKRTAMIPLPDCFLVFERGVMVTVLERKADVVPFVWRAA